VLFWDAEQLHFERQLGLRWWRSSYGTLNNCTLSGNAAYYGGGGYYSTLNNCALCGNSASDGGGSYGGTLNNCALSGKLGLFFCWWKLWRHAEQLHFEWQLGCRFWWRQLFWHAQKLHYLLQYRALRRQLLQCCHDQLLHHSDAPVGTGKYQC